MVLAAAARMEAFSIDHLTDQLENARAQIEKRFLDGGAVLETVVETLTGLIGLLTRTSDSLREKEAADSIAGLKTTAELLKVLPEDHAARSGNLKAIRETAGGLAGHARAMEETLRYLRTFAMTAKIAGANIPDFSGFAAEIVERIRFATSEVEALSEQVAALELNIGGATADGGTSLEHHFEKIPGIIERLLGNAHEIQSQRRNLSEMAGKVAELARKVQGKVAQTLSAMQIGDITRQRIEHCQSAYAIVDEYMATAEAKARLSEQDRDRLLARVTALVFELLSQAAGEYTRDTGKVVQNIGSFCNDIAALLDLYRNMISENGQQKESPIRLLQNDLTAASIVVDDIGVAVTAANRLSEGTAATVKVLTSSVQTIQLVRRDIQYMALNTNLRCSKLGDEARAINVVTAELRTFSSNLDEEAEKILGGLTQLQSEATVLGKGPSGGDQGGSSDLGASIATVLAHLADAATSMDANIEALRDYGETVTSKIAHVATQLDFKGGIGETLAACVEEARQAMGRDGDPAGLEDALATLSERISKTYTMVAEREIHAGVFGSIRPELSAAPDERDDDDLLADALF